MAHGLVYFSLIVKEAYCYIMFESPPYTNQY